VLALLVVDNSGWLGSVLSGRVGLTDPAPAVAEGRETLSEALQEALGNTLVRALERKGADPPDVVREAFNQCHLFSHSTLHRLVGTGAHSRDVVAFLNRASQVERQYGRRLWDPDLVQQDLAAEEKRRTLPRASNAPRLFISYRWAFDASYDEELSLIIHEFAGWLFGRGYDIVYDRDPRHIGKGFSSDELLWLLPSCSQMIAIVDDGYQARVLEPGCTSPACQEFALAPHLFDANKQPRLLGLWFKGEQLRGPLFSDRWVVDFRDPDVFHAKRDKAFPVRKYQVECQQGDSLRALGPLERRSVQPLVEKLLTEDPTRRILVRDVTK
jgi:hypothetical protein